MNASLAAGVAAKSDLYPTLSIVGNVSYADPDSRRFPVQDVFNLSWSIGARVRYDVGGIPGATERAKAADADAAARAVANSALVKTAITGADPNWGRIVSAAGYAGVAFDPRGVSLDVNLVCRKVDCRVP